MTKQADLFSKPQLPKLPKLRRMHVSDADDGSEGMHVRYHCMRCNHETGWLTAQTVTVAKQGIPCPHCNFVCYGDTLVRETSEMLREVGDRLVVEENSKSAQWAGMSFVAVASHGYTVLRGSYGTSH